MKAYALLLLGAALGAAWSSSALALDEAALRRYVEAQIGDPPGRVEVDVGTLDFQRRAACARMEPFLPPGARLWGRTSIGVRCVEGASWSTYVPVVVRIYGPALVAARGLGAGQALQPEDLKLDEVELTRYPPGLLTDPADAENRVLLRTLNAGEPIRVAHLRGRQVIASGALVTLSYSGPGFTVSVEGRALSAASAGQPVRVQTTSGKILTGIAREDGVVEIRS